MSTKKKAFSRSTMSLRDFHGGTIPSELALPSAPGTMPERSSVYDRQNSGIRTNSSIVSRGFGGERGMFLRQSSGNGVRSFEEKASFFPNPATIGRNYDEDERKPVDSYLRRGYSSNSYDDDRPPYEKRRPVSARSYDHQTLLDKPLDERANRPSSAPYQEIGRDSHGPSELPTSSFTASIPKTQQQDTFQHPTVAPSSFSLGARDRNPSPTPMQEDQSRQISPRPPQYASRLPENTRSPPRAWKSQPQPQQFSGPPSGSATLVPNVWTARQEGEIGRSYSLDSPGNEASTGWRGESAASRFAQASAIEKVSSGRWNSRLFNDQSQERPHYSSQSPGHGALPEKQLSSSQPTFISESTQGMYKDISRGGRNDDFDARAFPHANHELDPDLGREQNSYNVVAAADPYRKRDESAIRHNSIDSGQKSNYMIDNLGRGSGDFERRGAFTHGNRQSDPDLEREQYAHNVVAVDSHRGRGETTIRHNAIDSGQRRSYMEGNLGRGSSDFERRSFPFGNRESDPDVGREQYTRNVVAVADSHRGRGESAIRHNVIDSGQRHRYMEDNSRYGSSDLERRAFPYGIRESDLDVGREQYTRNVVAAAESHRERCESAIRYNAIDSGQRRRYMEDNLGHGSSAFERKSSPHGNRESDVDVGREQYSHNAVAAGDTFRERDESAIRHNVINSGQRCRFAEDNLGYGSSAFERRALASPHDHRELDLDAGRGQYTSNVIAAVDTHRERDESARYNVIDSGQRRRYMEDNLGHGSSAFERRVSPHSNSESYPDVGRGQYVAAADIHRERDGSVIRHNAIDSEQRGRYMEDNLGHGSSDFERKAFLHGNPGSDPEEGREVILPREDPRRERGESAIRHNSFDSGQRFRYAEDNLGHGSSDFPRRPGNLYVDSSRDIGKGSGLNIDPSQAMYGWNESQGEVFDSKSVNTSEINKRGIPNDMGRARFQNIDTNVNGGPSRRVDPNRGLRLSESRGPLPSEVASQWHAGRSQLNANFTSRDLHVSEGMKSFQSSSGATKVEKARAYSPAGEPELPRDPAFRAPLSSDTGKLGNLSSPILDSRDPPVERPKLKLLPRSKPLEVSPANGSFQLELPKDSQQVSEPVQCELLPSDAGATIASNTSSGSGVAEKLEESNQSAERPKLVLKPRTLPTFEQVLDGSEKERQSVFGGARPRELVLKERGVDGSALEDNDTSIPLAGSGAESQSILQESSDQQERPDNEMLQSRRVETGNIKLLYDQESSRGVRRESSAIDKERGALVEKQELDKQDSWRRCSSGSFGSKASEITGGKYIHIPAPSAADLAVAFSRSTSLGGRPRGYISNILPPRRALGNYGLSPRDAAPFSRLASAPVPVPRQQVFATGFSHGFKK